MRLWSLHPRYLDARGLVALWREALLAQKVLEGRTRGYRNHPQLERFRRQRDPLASIASYLQAVHHEAVLRGYSFDQARIRHAAAQGTMSCTRGQIAHEWAHLKEKLRLRDPSVLRRLSSLRHPRPHPLFRMRPGPVEPWERIPPGG